MPPSTLTLGGLLKHMALVENHWFVCVWLGERGGRAVVDRRLAGDPDWDFDSAADDEPEQLLALFDGAVERSRSAIEGSVDLSTPPPITRDRAISLRWMLVHMIEEYARHCGHADLLRDSRSTADRRLARD